MAPTGVASLIEAAGWTCKQCTLRSRPSNVPRRITRTLSTTAQKRSAIAMEDSGIQKSGFEINAAPPIDFAKTVGEAARLVPASPSYFTTSPVFNDVLLRLTRLVETYAKLPTVHAEQAPQIAFLTLLQFRSSMSEKVGAAKYSKIVELLRRLNTIKPSLRPVAVQNVLEEFRKPGSAAIIPPRPRTIDEFGRAKGVGRRKSAVARVQLIEGDGQVVVNGKALSQAFPRLHDRESVIWPLKITNRLDKYNAFVVSSGGGLTGQAESITLGMAHALIVHEPALKPVLRKAGCVTRVMKRVERKKTGRVKARKRPAWVKR